MKILIVHDDFVKRAQLRDILSIFGECEVAPDGTLAVQRFKDAVDNKRAFDLVCLDLDPPSFSGVDALKIMRDYELLREVVRYKKEAKILVITTNSKVVAMEAFKYGCDGILEMPLTSESVKNALREIRLIS